MRGDAAHGQPSLLDQGLYASAFATSLAVVFLLTFIPPVANDLFLQLRVGEIAWTHHEIPKTIAWTFTEARDFPFHAHEWLPSVAFFLLERWLGFDNLIWVVGAFGLALFLGCFALAQRVSGDRSVALFLALLTMVAGNYRFFLRPELFALACLLAVSWLLFEYRRSGRYRWLAPILPVYVVWINSHGSFPVALVLAGLFAAGEGIDAAMDERRRNRHAAVSALARAAAARAAPYALVVLAMLVLSALNPEGYRLLLFPLELSSSQAAKQFVAEWRPTFSDHFRHTDGFAVYLYYMAFCIVTVALAWRRIGTSGLLVMLAFGILSGTRNRYIIVFAFAALFALALAWRRDQSASRGLARRTTALLLATTVVAIPAVLSRGNLYGGYSYFVPNILMSDIMRGAMTHVSGPVLNSYPLGAEIIYRAYPRAQPAIDSRIDSYGDRYFLDWKALFEDEQALERFLARYDVRFMLLALEDFDRIGEWKSLQSSGWRVLVSDHKMVLLGR